MFWNVNAFLRRQLANGSEWHLLLDLSCNQIKMTSTIKKKRENYTQLTHLREKILTFCFIIFGLAPHPKQKHQQQTKKKQNTVTQKKKKKKKGETASTNSIPQLILPHKLTGHSPNGTSSSSSLKLPSRMPSMTWLPLSMLTNRSFTVGSSFTATEKHWHWRL